MFLSCTEFWEAVNAAALAGAEAAQQMVNEVREGYEKQLARVRVERESLRQALRCAQSKLPGGAGPTGDATLSAEGGGGGGGAAGVATDAPPQPPTVVCAASCGWWVLLN
jgi:hypothetical protein